MAVSTRKLLILDLDETLIHSSEHQLARPADFRVGRFHVYKRPYLDIFLARSLEWFDVAVWTSSSPQYAAEIVGAIFNDAALLAFLWANDRCTQAYDSEVMDYYWKKNLEKVKRQGRALASVIVVDDTQEAYRTSYGNLVKVSPFHGEGDDIELYLLLQYLDLLRDVGNARSMPI